MTTMTKSEYDRLTNSACSLLDASNDPFFGENWQNFFYRVAMDEVAHSERYIDNFHLSTQMYQTKLNPPIGEALQAA
jgi:hypothetical protein